jgi:hypothetical protein
MIRNPATAETVLGFAIYESKVEKGTQGGILYET